MTRLPTPQAERVLDTVAAIPAGQVRSYAQVGQAAGTSARAVGSVLAKYGSGVPWWRVVRWDGRLATGLEAQAADRLAAEGVALVHGTGGWRVLDPDWS